LSKRWIIVGVEVGVFLPDPGKIGTIEAKISEAFALLRDFGPKYLARVKSLADGILLFHGTDALGSWTRDARLIQVSQGFIADPETKPVHIAATIVHEATHAWLDHLGFTYTPARRARIEAICYRTESAFARKLPDSEDVAREYEMCAQLVLEQPDEEWSDAAFRSRTVARLVDLGVPGWAARLVSRSSSVLPNERCS